MKKLFIIANWKSNKTIKEAEEWIRKFKEEFERESFDISSKEIIICPSFTVLKSFSDSIKSLNFFLKIGAQDISSFDQGAYTGEVNGLQIKESADYVIVGHSERRTNFNESSELISKKADMARRYGIVPIFCVQDETTPIPDKIAIVAYEPPSAIGTGKPDTPENAEEVAKKIKEENKAQFVLYGGSVTSENVKLFSAMQNIDGFLIGGASLDPSEFLQIIKNA
ncbi:MAG: triose-phosphate isomerase [Patescibacteria group bacterium]